MALFDKNLKILAEHYQGMDELIREASAKLQPELEITLQKSEDSVPILKVKKKERECYLGGKRNALEAPEMWVKSLGELQTNAPIFFMGIGNPFYLKELVEQTKAKITIIVYEPSLQIFLQVLEMIDLERLMEKQMIVFWVKGLEGMETQNIKGILANVLRYEMLPYSRHLILPNYDVLFGEDAVEFMKICRNIVTEELIQFNTKKLFSEVMVKNLLSNARYLCEGYTTTQLVKVIPRSIPGILVAAGPSLNKNIAELKRAKGRAFIVAVDTAIKPLLEAGIIPDMFAIIDAIKPVELVKVEEAKNIPMYTLLEAASEVLQYHTGMKIFSNEGFGFSEKIFARSGQPFGVVSCGGSVATSAFSLLYKIGIDTIILVGQDLAYTNNRSHADGTFQEIMPEQDTSRFVMVEGNYEEKVPTVMDLKQFLEWYNMYIEGCKEHRSSFRVINATEGGAKIKNTEIMTLREAIDRECEVEVDIQECLKRLPPMLDEEKQKWAKNYLYHLPEEFKALASDAGKALHLYAKLDQVCQKKNVDQKEYLNTLRKIEKQIKAIDGQNAYQLVSITFSQADYILRNEQFLQENSFQKEGQEIARKGKLYMENVKQCALLFNEYAEEIYKDLADPVEKAK